MQINLFDSKVQITPPYSLLCVYLTAYVLYFAASTRCSYIETTIHYHSSNAITFVEPTVSEQHMDGRVQRAATDNISVQTFSSGALPVATQRAVPPTPILPLAIGMYADIMLSAYKLNPPSPPL